MKKKIRLILITIVCTFLLSTSIVGAASIIEDIKATINKEIKITWNGEEFSPTEENGTVLHPIIYNGRSYLPVRFIAEKAGVKVDWDNKTKTIILS